MPELWLRVVGSGPAFTTRPEPSSCYLVELGDDALVLDLGQGSFSALGAIRDPASLLAIFVSHSHPDHGVDLVALRHYLMYGAPEPRRVPLHAPPDLRRRYDVLTGEEDFLSMLPGDPLAAGGRFVGPFAVTVAPVMHAESSFGFRVSRAAQADTSPGLVYSGDCGREEDLLGLLRPGDTLLCEASFGAREPVPGVAHLTAAQAGRVAATGGAARLVLTHILDAAAPEEAVSVARRHFSGEVLRAVPELLVPIG